MIRVELLDEYADVYDITVEDTHNFYANGILVHNCTEIGLRTSDSESSVCNLHSVNVGADKHLLKRDASQPSGFEWNTELEKTVRITLRALDSVITVARVPHEKGAVTNSKDRPVGMGQMGEAVAMQKVGVDWESLEHIQYANELARQITLTAIDESANLARKLGSFETFEHSTWAQGLLPIDTVNAKFSVAGKFNLYTSCDTPWATGDELREKVKGGMRNAVVSAIAPTASIANIINTTPCIELPYNLQFEKENLNGQFYVVAPTAIHNPHNIKVKTVREVDQKWSILAACARQLWICQAQSLNIYLNEETDGDGNAISDFYFTAWENGAKSTYYLRGLSASEEKPSPEIPTSINEVVGAACFLRPGDEGFDECEACQ